LLAKGAWVAAGDGGAAPHNQRRIQVALFYLQAVLPHTAALADNVMSGGDAVLIMRAQWLNG
jgi:hypothetical protein